ncbi:MAG: electron transporter RnfG [Alcanivorax borkumensis]|uniref:Ion-translocating oxidoreductase complex subunit G n=1 Tax=Alcanivorax borkumensis (strain ATCC 700651 / DSM 11573 / NCIMB 13689 / SK2) TaxID=393595 RepID=Q0VP37_ALCBS|nr:MULTISPECIES: electron transport complex subunit RsxG [Alcanivorax]OJH08324.1 MAG: electron transporter RnfG [Alcanivorax borkumensis]BAP14519.1 electron complex protein RnfG [Alcanivorax sp. NBRC 101098]CAL17061.1 electron complex protein rnfG, putative [Alcanivorax borkumensis SK2]
MMRYAITKNAVILGLFAIGTAATLAITNEATLDQVRCNKQQALMTSLNQVMPHHQHDNDLLADRITVNDPLLGRSEQHLYRARLNGENSGAVLEANAPDGYGGAIALIVGVDTQGQVQGVRVVPPHNETPGLGDSIETKKSDWILGFNGHSLGNPEAAGWAVKKDGGEFDSFTGATITPRAVVGAVHRALQYFSANQNHVFSAPADTTPVETCDE